jgi:hypothetical protein
MSKWPVGIVFETRKLTRTRFKGTHSDGGLATLRNESWPLEVEVGREGTVVMYPKKRREMGANARCNGCSKQASRQCELVLSTARNLELRRLESSYRCRSLPRAGFPIHHDASYQLPTSVRRLRLISYSLDLVSQALHNRVQHALLRNPCLCIVFFIYSSNSAVLSFHRLSVFRHPTFLC